MAETFKETGGLRIMRPEIICDAVANFREGATQDTITRYYQSFQKATDQYFENQAATEWKAQRRELGVLINKYPLKDPTDSEGCRQKLLRLTEETFSDKVKKGREQVWKIAEATNRVFEESLQKARATEETEKQRQARRPPPTAELDEMFQYHGADQDSPAKPSKFADEMADATWDRDYKHAAQPPARPKQARPKKQPTRERDFEHPSHQKYRRKDDDGFGQPYPK